MEQTQEARKLAGQGELREVSSQSSNDCNRTEKRLSPQAKWAARNPKAAWAHGCLRNALRRGLVTKQPCEVCGSAEVDGHHDSYDTPMIVRWRCRLHHNALHRAMKCEVVE